MTAARWSEAGRADTSHRKVDSRGPVKKTNQERHATLCPLVAPLRNDTRRNVTICCNSYLLHHSPKGMAMWNKQSTADCRRLGAAGGFILCALGAAPAHALTIIPSYDASI